MTAQPDTVAAQLSVQLPVQLPVLVRFRFRFDDVRQIEDGDENQLFDFSNLKIWEFEKKNQKVKSFLYL